MFRMQSRQFVLRFYLTSHVFTQDFLSWRYACSIYGAFNDCMSRVELGEAYAIIKDVEWFFKTPKKQLWGLNLDGS